MSKRYRGELLEGRSHKEGEYQFRWPILIWSRWKAAKEWSTKGSMSSQDTFKFEGEDLTTCEIVSELNQKEGDGVKFDCDSC